MKKFKKFIILFLLCMFLYLIIRNYELIRQCFLFSYTLFLNNIFPNLFIFMVISDLLINYGFVNILSNIFGNIFSNIFNIHKNATYVFFMSLFTGSPSNAKYTKDLLDKGLIDDISANKILMITHFPNPLFLISMVSVLSIKIAYLVLICVYIPNFIIGLIFRKIKFNNKMYNFSINNQESFSNCLSKSISSNINILITIFGTILIFVIISSLLKKILFLSPFYHSLVSGILEMTQGIKYVSNLIIIDNKVKAMLMTLFLSFGGFSIHAQVSNIINETKIKYQLFLISRLIHASIAVFLIYLIL